MKNKKIILITTAIGVMCIIVIPLLLNYSNSYDVAFKDGDVYCKMSYVIKNRVKYNKLLHDNGYYWGGFEAVGSACIKDANDTDTFAFAIRNSIPTFYIKHEMSNKELKLIVSISKNNVRVSAVKHYLSSSNKSGFCITCNLDSIDTLEPKDSSEERDYYKLLSNVTKEEIRQAITEMKSYQQELFNLISKYESSN